MAAAKRQAQGQARQLRQQGWSLRQIARHLGVSLASASVWTRGVAPEPTTPPAVPTPTPDARGTKLCTRCRERLPLTEFHRKTYWCKRCRGQYIRDRGELHRRQTRIARERRRTEARRFVLDVLAAGTCVDCELADPLVLEFDHVGPKTAAVSALVHEGYRLARIKAEIARCELVCANCHRRRTALRANSWRVNPDWATELDDHPRRRRNLLVIVDHLRRAACHDCGETDLVVLEFDHVGTKRGSVVGLALFEHSIASLEREIRQCEIRCANCHRRRTIRQRPDHLRHHLVEPL